MEQTISGKQLQKKLLDVEKHGLGVLKKFIVPLVVLYIAYNPQSATVFMMEYFKIDPSLALLIIQYALPLTIGISLARLVSMLWLFPLRQLVGYSSVILLCPILWVLKHFKPGYLNNVVGWMERHEAKEILRYKQKKVTGLEREIFFINRSTAIIFAVGLYIAQFYNNPVGQSWNPAFNKELMIVTNAHYYCQITGNYNEEQCKKWKADLVEYRKKLDKKQ